MSPKTRGHFTHAQTVCTKPSFCGLVARLLFSTLSVTHLTLGFLFEVYLSFRNWKYRNGARKKTAPLWRGEERAARFREPVLVAK